MLFKRIPVPANNVTVGMYVAALDRPWLETPFTFQGFSVKDDRDLALLDEHCDVVYVDTEQSSIAPEQIRALAKKTSERPRTGDRRSRRKLTLARRLLLSLANKDPTGLVSRALSAPQRVHENKVKFKKEAPRALSAHTAAQSQFASIMERVENGGSLDSEKLQDIVRPLVDSIERNRDSMAWLVYMRKYDQYTYGRALATSVWAVILGQQLGMSREDLEDLGQGGLLLDLGKCKISAAILNKAGRLQSKEYEIVKSHVQAGMEVLQSDDRISQNILDMVQHHHERFDGGGYPNGVSGQNTPMFGRIAAVVDCYDALTTKRAYSPAMSPYDAIRELNSLEGQAFQPELVEQLVHAIGMFPTGSVVELNTGAVGIVVTQNRVRRLRPEILMILDVNKQPIHKQRTINLRRLPGSDNDTRGVWIRCGHDPETFGINPNDYFL